MKKIFVALSMVAFLAACDDSSSASAGQNDEPAVESSSSSSGKVTEPAEVTSSSSDKTSVSSSSSADELSSSSLVEISSCSEGEGTSSSSGQNIESSSSSASGINCSELLESETGWSWDVPKECRFNPDIDYGTMTDSRDGKVYRTVKIGDQVWMAEKLNFDPGQGGSGEDKYDWSWCYDNEPKKCDVAGRLYTWAAAIDSVKLATDTKNPQDCGDGKKCALPDTVYGICPPGWHLPSKAEFGTLLTVMGGQSTASNVLKSQSGWAESKNGTDAFGFSALPVGGWAPLYGFYLAGNGAYFWSATGFDADYAEHLGIDYDKENTFLDFAYKHSGSSVRCIKNN